MKPLILLSFLFLSGIHLQGQFENVVIQTEKINDHLYFLVGAGGNIGICVGEDGILMIDDQFAPLTERILEAVSDISDQPVQYVVNTHWHCLLYTSPSPRDATLSRMPSSA